MSKMAVAFKKMLESGINGSSEKLCIHLDVLYPTGDVDYMIVERINESMSFRWRDIGKSDQGEADSYYASGCQVRSVLLRRSLMNGCILKFNTEYGR